MSRAPAVLLVLGFLFTRLAGAQDVPPEQSPSLPPAASATDTPAAKAPAAVPDAKRPDAKRPDAQRPDAKKPDTKKSDTKETDPPKHPLPVPTTAGPVHQEHVIYLPFENLDKALKDEDSSIVLP
ncbi:MAG: hypothetical protein U1E05_06920, partial [Patescibacteria group bacterium]|nr:hypothetical protein [Patescibacteria group bacterium]